MVSFFDFLNVSQLIIDDRIEYKLYFPNLKLSVTVSLRPRVQDNHVSQHGKFESV